MNMTDTDGNKIALTADGGAGKGVVECSDGTKANLSDAQLKAAAPQMGKNFEAIYSELGPAVSAVYKTRALLGHADIPMGQLESPITPYCEAAKAEKNGR